MKKAKTANAVSKILSFLGLACLLFSILCQRGDLLWKLTLGGGFALLLAGLVVSAIWERCPHCHRYIGAVRSGQYCPHCGKEIL